jgi:CheY-like chemotaxis protein
MQEQLLTGKSVLVVDDEIDLRDIVALELEYIGARVIKAENIERARDLIKSEFFDLVISDIQMPGGTGIELLKFIKAQKSQNLPVILFTGFADITPEEAFDKGAEALINKPFSLEEILELAVKLTQGL